MYKRERHTAFGHGLSDGEKKDTSDNFELHLGTGEFETHCSRTYRFLVPKMELI